MMRLADLFDLRRWGHVVGFIGAAMLLASFLILCAGVLALSVRWSLSVLR